MTRMEFVRARFDEDEQAAHVAAETHGGSDSWAYDPAVDPDYGADPVMHIGNRVIPSGLPGDDDPIRSVELRHIARHDPKRELAEVEAKRRLLDWLDEVDRTCDNEDLTWWRLGGHFDTDHARSLLALPYADHEDYREEWRP